MRFRFLEFELDAASFRLLRFGRPIDLTPLSLELLIALIEHRGQLVHKRDLQSTLWKGRPVQPSTIPTAVAALRKALGDSAPEPRIIQTVYGRGYRFIAPVEMIEEEGPELRSVAPSACVTRGFVGRSREIDATFRAIAGKERRGSVLLIGEAGFGKSRFLEEMGGRLRNAGALVALGHASEIPGAPAYGPWRAALGAIDDSIEDTLRPLVEGVPASASQEYADSYENAEAIRYEAFERVGRAIASMARKQPVVILIDDVHKADEASLLFLSYLLSEAQLLDVHFVLSMRAGSGVGARRTSELIGRCLRSPSIEEVQLTPFDREEVREFVESNCGFESSEAVIDALFRRTGGHPFFTSYLARRLDTVGALSPEELENRLTELGPAVRDAVLGQLIDLPRHAQECLAIAAAVGRRFSATLLSGILGCGPEEVLRFLEPALDQRVIERCDEPGGFRFVHLLVRDAIYESLTPRRRREIHHQIVVEYERVHGEPVGEKACELVRHAVESAEASGYDRVVSYSWAAAEWSASVLAFDEAAGFLRNALSLVEVSGGSWRTRCELLIESGRMLRLAGQRTSAQTVFRDAAGLARRSGDAELMGRAALGYAPGFFAIEAGIVDEFLVAVLEEALEMVGQSNVRLRAMLLARLAVALYWSERQEEVRGCADEAVALAATCDDAGLLADVVTAREVALWGPSEPERRATIAEWAIGEVRETQDRERELLFRLYRLTNLLQMGRFEELDREVETFSHRAEASLQPNALWYRDLFGALRAMMRGEWQDAELLAESFVSQGRAVGDRNAENCGVIHEAYRMLEYGDERRAVEIIARQADRFPRVRSYGCGRVMLGLYGDRRRECEREFEQIAGDGFGRFRQNVEWLISIALLSEACCEIGDRSRARELYGLLRPHEDEFVVVVFSVAVWRPVSFFLGRLAATFAAWPEAERYFEAAIQSSEKAGARPWLADARFRYAEMLRERGWSGDRLKAKDLVLSAEDIAEALAMKPLLKRIRRYKNDERRSGLA